MDTLDTHNIMDIVIDIAPLNVQQTEVFAVNSLGAKKLCTPAHSAHPIPVRSSFRDGITTPFFFFFFGLKTPYVAHSKCSVIFQYMNQCISNEKQSFHIILVFY